MGPSLKFPWRAGRGIKAVPGNQRQERLHFPARGPHGSLRLMGDCPFHSDRGALARLLPQRAADLGDASAVPVLQ